MALLSIREVRMVEDAGAGFGEVSDFQRLNPRSGKGGRDSEIAASGKRRLPDDGGMFGGDLEQRAGRAAGLDGSAFPFADCA